MKSTLASKHLYDITLFLIKTLIQFIIELKNCVTDHCSDGIQRAFKLAGAKNVLVAVKKVDDKATQLLMEYFYTNVAAGEDYVSALKNAQLKMIKHPIFNAPEYWSHFILIGR